MKLREHVSGLLSRLKGSNDSRKQRKQQHLRSLLVEHLEGRRLLAVIDLATIGSQGTIFYGADVGDASGISVSSAGDINGDGYDDMIIGALQADASGNAKSNAGESYVVFGAATLPSTIDLGTMGFSTGFRIFGSDIDDFSGSAVSGVGDVNGDGLDDLIVGASFADGLGNAKSYAGDAYLIFGAPSFAANIDLSASLGSTGMKIYGADSFDQSGFSVSNAGDVNGDGFNDLAIGANQAAAASNAKPGAGDSYVIFGAATMPTDVDLSALGSAGITIYGADAYDQSGYSISSAGDVNGDGFDDLILGAVGGDASGNAKLFAGDSYILFGSSALPSAIDLAVLGTATGSAGVTIFGSEANDESGFSVSSAGDVNGDGFDDVIVGARYGDAASNAKANAGESYVIYGAASMPVTIDLASLGSAGIIIYGLDAGDQSGFSVSGAGDVNADGYDDLIIGALKANTNGNTRATGGESYVVFGGPALTSTIDLAALAAAGITIYGFGVGDESGTSVSAAGDVNGDGFDDVIIGAFAADAAGNAKAGAGESYVVFGRNTFTNSITAGNLGTSGNNTINGTSGAENINGADGDDTLVGAGGADVINGGRGDDILAISDLSFNRIVGGSGNDTLRLDGSGLTLDLEVLADNRILGIETIDITGAGDNILAINRKDVLRISDTSNVLLVRGNAGDRVSTIGWTQGASELIGLDTFDVYTQGNATLKILQGVVVQYTLNLAALSAARGATFYGAEADDQSGFSVSGVGDVNGDGFDDMIIGAQQADAAGNAKIQSGDSYLIYGSAALPATIDLASLGTAGVTIFGEHMYDTSGFSVSRAGDVNGDGFADILIGAPNADTSSALAYSNGKTYVVFGGPSLPSSIDLSALGSGGTTILGGDQVDMSGRSVSAAGDVNGDGFDDVIIGADFADGPSNANPESGESYVVFGAASLPSNISLGSLGSAGSTIYGVDTDDRQGFSVSTAGDVNGDGLDDLLIGALNADGVGNAESNAGESYLIFGNTSFPASISLASLGGAGVTIVGENANDASGFSVSGGGDLNGDGYEDMLIGSPSAGASGRSYVLFGGSSLSGTIDLASLGSAGVVIDGIISGNKIAVSRAGDVNGDGFDDLIIGNFLVNGADGQSHVVFGNAVLPSTISLADLGKPSNPIGITLLAADNYDGSGFSVRAAGDVNGDGFDDVVIGAYVADSVSNGRSNAGESYLVYGRDYTGQVTHPGTAQAETLAGSASADVLIGGRGNDTIAGNGGSDVIIGGQGDDVLSVTSTTFSRIDGGTGSDTLQLVGNGLTLDLTTLSNTKLFDIETIDLTGTGNNTLTLDLDEVLNLSDTSNTLIVRRNAGDVVNRGVGWTQGANQIIGPDTFAAYTQGTATLLVQMASPTVTLNLPLSKVYDKLVHVATATIIGADAPSPTLSFTYYSDAGGTTTISAPTNAGTYYVRAFTAANATNLASQSAITQFIISQKLLTATFTNGGATKTYNSSTAASVANANITLIGVISGDTVTATATGTFNNKNVGTNKPVVIDTVVLAGASNLNYTISSGGSLTSNINLRTLTVNGTAPAGVTGISKVYDGNNSATVNVSLAGVQAPDVITATANGTFSNKDAGTGKTVTVAVSSAITIAGTEISNYTIGNTGAAIRTTTANITPKALTATAAVDTKVYDATTAATISYSALSGFIGLETVTATGTGTFSDKNVANGKSVTADVPILVNGTNGGLAANYSLATPTGLTGDVTPASISVITGITANNKVYDATTAATLVTSGASFTGKFGGDDLTVATSTGTFVDKDATNGKTVNITGLTLGGLDVSNYTLASSTASTTADITPKALTATATVDTKVYDANNAATISYAALFGFIGLETVTATGTGTFNDKNVANSKPVTADAPILVNGTNGGLATNYSLATPTGLTGDITPASISVITGITANNKVYDATTAATLVTSGASFTGKFGGDTLTVATSTGNFVDKNVANGKSVNITGLSLGGADAANYTLASTTASTTADITTASISTITGITANNKIYDATTAATLVTSGASFTGKFGGDTLTVASSTGNFDNANVGTGKTVNITGLALGGADASNYTLVSTTASTTANISAAVINRRVFYNGATAVGGAGATGFGASGTVGNSFAATGGNPPATAIDSKLPLLPGGSSSFNNYTNTSFGLNGIIVDMGIPVGNTLTPSDFSFATGETLASPGFTTLVGGALTAVNPQVTQYAAGGINGSTRAKLTFNNNSLKNIWLKVTVLANANTGLAADNVFYFGNVVGDTNGSITSSRYTVNAIDTSGVRNNQSSVPGSVLVTNIYDFNKTGNVNALDTSVVRTNQQSSGIVRVIASAPSFLASGEEDGMAPTIESSMGISASNFEETESQPLTLSSSSQNGSLSPTVSQPTQAGQAKLDSVAKSKPSSLDSENIASLDAFFAAFGAK